MQYQVLYPQSTQADLTLDLARGVRSFRHRRNSDVWLLRTRIRTVHACQCRHAGINASKSGVSCWKTFHRRYGFRDQKHSENPVFCVPNMFRQRVLITSTTGLANESILISFSQCGQISRLDPWRTTVQRVPTEKG